MIAHTYNIIILHKRILNFIRTSFLTFLFFEFPHFLMVYYLIICIYVQ